MSTVIRFFGAAENILVNAVLRLDFLPLKSQKRTSHANESENVCLPSFAPNQILGHFAALSDRRVEEIVLFPPLVVV
jgi:hypothetical protein